MLLALMDQKSFQSCLDKKITCLKYTCQKFQNRQFLYHMKVGRTMECQKYLVSHYQNSRKIPVLGHSGSLTITTCSSLSCLAQKREFLASFIQMCVYFPINSFSYSVITCKVSSSSSLNSFAFFATYLLSLSLTDFCCLGH